MKNAAKLLLLAISMATGCLVQAAPVIYTTDPANGHLVRADFPDGSYIEYSYDENGNRTGATVTQGADTQAPTAPGAPSFSAITANSVTISFTGSTDNVGVTGYQYRPNGPGSTWVGTGAGTATTFTLTGLTSGTTYNIAIRARDAAPNFSAPSATVAVTTLDNVAPTAPGTPSFSAITATSATATWTASTDNVGVTGYQYRLNGGTWIDTGSTATTFTITGLTQSTTYTVNIRSRDQAANFSPSSGTANLTTSSSTDTQAPTTPGTPSFSAISLTGATATWAASTDNVAVTGYQYSLNGGTWTNTGSASATFNLSGLTPGTAYTLAVRARDAAGNTSAASGNGSFTTTADTSPPTAPGTPSFSSITATSMVVSWTASTDNVGVTSYQYRPNGPGSTWVGTGAGTATSFTLTGLTPGTTYNIAIRARDQAVNFSSPSATVAVTTLDDVVPTTPGTPSFSSIAATSATASWTASTDNVAVTGYEYSLNGGAWTSTGSASASFGLTGLTNATNYTFAVRAKDGAGNVSASSPAGSFKTLDNAVPSTPGTPGFSSITASSAAASWTASTDNVAVTGYEYSLNGGAWTSTGSASPGLSLSGLSGSTNYSLAVRARDAAGNFSGASGAGSFTTLDGSPPTTPGTPGFSGVTHNAASATWSASTDNIGVTGYEYSLNGAAFTSTGSASPGLALSGLSPVTTYTLVVRARDAAGNLSGSSGTGSFTTGSPPDTTPPGAPGTPAFSAVTATTATLSWGAASDNVGVTGYEYSLNGGGSWSSAGGSLSVNLTGLSAATTYSVQVRARDAAGNTGSASSASLSTIAQVTISNRTVTVHTSPGSPQAVYVLSSSGDILASPPTSIPPVDSGDWLAPKVGMTNFQVLATLVSGSCGTGSFNSWLNISNGPSWSRVGIGTCVLNLQIRNTADTSVILGTAQITLTGN